MNQIEYNGSTLERGKEYFWRVRVWDDEKEDPSSWSAEGTGSAGISDLARFRMGFLDKETGSGDGWVPTPMPGATAIPTTDWIAVKDAEKSARMGYRSLPTTDKSGKASVTIDLGEEKSFDQIILYPVWWPPEQPGRDDGLRPVGPGYLFPQIYSIIGSRISNFQKGKDTKVLVKQKVVGKADGAEFRVLKPLGGSSDLYSIGHADTVVEPIDLKEGEKFRFIRILVEPTLDSEALEPIHESDPIREYGFDPPFPCCTYGIAFAEIQVLENDVNLALDKPVSGMTIGSDGTRTVLVDEHPWKPEYLTDGINHSGSVPSSYFRMKEKTTIPSEFCDSECMEAEKDKLLAYVIGLGAYDVFINGQSITGDGVGKFALGPGWTNFFKRIQYQVFDLANLDLKADQDILVSAIVGDGRFLDRCWVLGNSIYGQKHLFRLQIVWDDVSENTQKIIVQTNSGDWVGTITGPIRYSSIDHGELYVKGLELEGVNPVAQETPIPAWNEEGFPLNGWTLTSEIEPAPTQNPTVGASVTLPSGTTIKITAEPPMGGSNAGFKLPLIITGDSVPDGEIVRIMGVTPYAKDTVSTEDMIIYQGTHQSAKGAPPIGFTLPGEDDKNHPNLLQVDLRRNGHEWHLTNNTTEDVEVTFGWRAVAVNSPTQTPAGETVFPIPTETPSWTTRPAPVCDFTL
ncbi:MAG: alpha-L-rhamnosidase N-terminal domain-containing protein, partial [Candidatus Omnitrophica bacterium]|nr:alpha-L-rhamnosidase N-terminal domain-containing protein [Candidatus Omnitrophota bacterium]